MIKIDANLASRPFVNHRKFYMTAGGLLVLSRPEVLLFSWRHLLLESCVVSIDTGSPEPGE